MKKLILVSAILGLSSLAMGNEFLGDEVVRNVRLNIQGGNFDEGIYDEDISGVSGEFEIGLRNGNITNSIGLGVNYYDSDDTDGEVTTFEIYYSPRYTFDNNWYVSGRLGYSVGDDTYSHGFWEEELDMTGFVFGMETGYTFDNNFSVHLGYKAVETELTEKWNGLKYSEDGYTHLGYLGMGYTF